MRIAWSHICVKNGNFGNVLIFFYFAHHMSTIVEWSQQMIKICEFSRIIRSHGMNREYQDVKLKNKNVKKLKNLKKDFIFLYPSYNLRSTEINAVLGINQISRLDKNIKKRNHNFKFFLKNLDPNKYFTKFDMKGISNYALIICLIKNIKTFL